MGDIAMSLLITTIIWQAIGFGFVNMSMGGALAHILISTVLAVSTFVTGIMWAAGVTL